MSRHREWDLQCKVYVGNLGPNAARADLETAFSKYGALKNVWVARNPPGFAFVEFEDTRDAEDAVRALDGSRLGGDRIRVEMSSGRRRNTRGGGNGGGGGGGYSNGGRRGGGGRGGGRRFSPRGPRSPRRNRSRSRERTLDQRSRSRSYSRENSRSRSPN